MIGSIGAQIGLLSFAATLLVGVAVGNGLTVVLTRALAAMFAGAIVGQFAGWAAKAVLRESLQRRKHEIDTAHFDAIRAMDDELDDGTDATLIEGE